MRMTTDMSRANPASDGCCYLALFQEAFRIDALCHLGLRPSGLRLRCYASQSNWGQLASGRFSLTFGMPASASLNEKFLAHITEVDPSSSLLRARDVLNLLTDDAACGQPGDAIIDLVNQTVPTNSPRAFHSVVREVHYEQLGQMHHRALHALPQLADLASSYSRAHWTHCELLFVPTPSSAGRTLLIDVCSTSSESPPVDHADLMSRGTCSHYVGGGGDRCPPVFSFPVVFAEANTSPLIKPAAIELPRTSVAFVVNAAEIGDNASEGAGEVLLRVIVKGFVRLGGQT
uniref:Uncharacterized protein n=1 Tax=Leafy-liverwort associated tymo-like virus TaxID=2933176 RepID=A0A9C7GWM8_9VIRU|nr:hypothetical protein [Leafy-liverwort associated tymo-like virus]CAI5383878.1 hypothetical protein [Leafy-liverwort associated tymo-like virus]